MTFDTDELEAIALGISMVRQWTDKSFADKAGNAFDKIQAVSPTNLQDELKQISTYSMRQPALVPWTVSFSEIRENIRLRRKVHIVYQDDSGSRTSRTIRPLALIFCSPIWLLANWCEKRNDFRHFRLDRIIELHSDETVFVDEKDKNLDAYLTMESACRIG